MTKEENIKKEIKYIISETQTTYKQKQNYPATLEKELTTIEDEATQRITRLVEPENPTFTFKRKALTMAAFFTTLITLFLLASKEIQNGNVVKLALLISAMACITLISMAQIYKKDQ